MKNVNQGKETPNAETKKVEEGDTANHFPNPKREEDVSATPDDAPESDVHKDTTTQPPTSTDKNEGDK